MNDARKLLEQALHDARTRYQRARYRVKVANSEQKETEAAAEFKAASIQLTKARRALVRHQ